MTTTRRRTIPWKGKVASQWSVRSDVFGNIANSGGSRLPSPNGPHGTQETTSENHPGWNRRKIGSMQGDVGGNFHTSKTSGRLKGGFGYFRGRKLVGGFQDLTTIYRGMVLPFDEPFPAFPPDVSSGLTTLNAYGTKAVNAVKPTNSLTDLSTTLGELIKDGMPTAVGAELWRAGTSRARNASGSEYLNVEFGWKPLVNDVLSTMNAMSQIDAAVRQYRRDAGRVVRRSYDFPPEESEVTSTFKSAANAVLAFSDSNLTVEPTLVGKVLRTRKTSVRRWFSGAFSYHLPYNLEGEEELNRAKQMLGTSLTPETLWNLAPWSWAVDWFIPVGDLIGNLQDMASDGLVLRYGYIMEHSYVSDTYTFVGPTGIPADLIPGTYVLSRETKKRVKATPYGFGLTWSGFSPRQLAILSALGLSRS